MNKIKVDVNLSHEIQSEIKLNAMKLRSNLIAIFAWNQNTGKGYKTEVEILLQRDKILVVTLRD